MELPLEVTCHEVEQLLSSDEGAVLLDCRQPDEHAVASLPGARLIPMDDIPQRAEELTAERERRIVVYCHHGVRSARVAAWLRQQGFAHAQSMAGGIDQWAQAIDRQMPRY